MPSDMRSCRCWPRNPWEWRNCWDLFAEGSRQRPFPVSVRETIWTRVSRLASRCGGYALRGPNMMMAIPAKLTATPTQSDIDGRTPSTSISHKMATLMYTPP